MEGGAGRGDHIPCLHHCSREGKGQAVDRLCESYAQQVTPSQLILHTHELFITSHTLIIEGSRSKVG